MNRSVERDWVPPPSEGLPTKKNVIAGEANVRDLCPYSMRFNMIIEWETPVIMVTLLLSGEVDQRSRINTRT